MKQFLKILILNIAVLSQVHFAYAQSSTASILPPAKTTFFDNNGKPLSKGTIDFYIPGTTDRKMTWQDAGQTIPNTNPVVLDTSGRGLILGDGSYRQVVKDKNGNVIWDQITSSTGSSGGGSTPTVGDGDVVGTVKAFSGFVAPYGYVFAYGQELVRNSYPEALAALTSQQNVSCTIGSPTLTGVGATTQLPIGADIESSCLNSGSTIISKTSSTVTASSNAIISTTTTARFFPYGNGDGSLTFNMPDLRGRVIAGNDIMGGIAANRIAGDAIAINLGNQNYSILRTDLPNVAPTFTGNISTVNVTQNNGFSPINPTSNTFVTATAAGGGVGGIVATTPGSNVAQVVSSGSYTPSGTVQSLNGNVSQTNIPLIQPTQTQNYIIKVIPDSNPNSFFGVASIGGMQGVINCGFGITCAGNTISAVNSTIPAPTPTTLGGVYSISCAASNWISSLDLTGTFNCTQPNFTDIAGILSVNKGGTGQTSFTANLPLIGNGTSAISQGSRSGNTTNFATVNGSLTSGNCVTIDGNGNLVDNGAPCGGGISGVKSVPDYSTLRSGSPSSILQTVFIQGRTTSNQQGSGLFTLVPGSSCSDNDGTILLDAANNCWYRQYDDGVHVDWFDFSSGNSATANTNAINSALSVLTSGGIISGKLIFPTGTYSYNGFSIDKATGLRITSAGGAITNPILRCALTSGSCITARSSFDVTIEYLDLRFTASNASTAYLINLQHAPASSIDTQGFYLYRSTLDGEDTLSGGVYNGNGINLDQSSSSMFEGVKFASLSHVLDGQNPAGGSYANEVRVHNCVFFDNEGFPLAYLGDSWSISDSFFQAGHDGKGRVAFSDNTTTWHSLSFRDVSVFDTTAGGTSYLTLGTGSKLTVTGGLWGGINTSNLLVANGVISGVSINTYATNFNYVAYANVAGQSDWIFAGSNVTGSTNLVGLPANITNLNTDGVTPNFSQGVNAVNGWRINPDGTKEVWGQVTIATPNSAQTLTYNSAFTTACYNFTAILQSPANVTNVLSLGGSCGLSSQTVYVSGTGSSTVSYRAIGR